jgi:hypothetical protein
VNQLTMGLDDLEALFASDENVVDYSFPLEDLMGTDLEAFDAGLTGQQGGEGTVDAAEGNLNGGQGGMEDWVLGSAYEIAMFDGILLNNNGSDLFEDYMSTGR